MMIVKSSNLQAILLIQFDIFKHEEKTWNKIILVNIVWSDNLHTTLLIQFDIFKARRVRVE